MVYGYARVSTVGQKKDGNSLADQRGLMVDKYPDAVIIEEAYSGKKQRPIFNELVDEKLQAGDTLVVTKLDRFCRDTKEGLNYIEKLRSKGVAVHILNMGVIDNTPMGQLMVTMLLAFAEFEWSLIRERTAAGRRVKRETDPNYREGRKEKELPELALWRERVGAGEASVVEACKALGISRRTWYNRGGAAV